MTRYMGSTEFRYDVERALYQDRTRALKVIDDAVIDMVEKGTLPMRKPKDKPVAKPKARKLRF
jgi:hypothetical protein